MMWVVNIYYSFFHGNVLVHVVTSDLAVSSDANGHVIGALKALLPA